MLTTPLVSVVIPVYNEEKYLIQSIESVVHQTYSNWECIIVNNCSEDSSLNIARHYEELDKRIVVYNNSKFLSQLENLNEALKKISKKSKYCKIVLGDDFIFNECLEKMVAAAESDPSIGLVSSYVLRGTLVANAGLPYGKSTYDGKEICKKYLLEDDFYVFGTQTSVLYLSDIVRGKDKFFNESSPSADTDICMEILEKYNLGFVNQVLSFTRIDNISERDIIRNLDPGNMRRLILHKKYGKIFLNQDEYDRAYKHLLTKYYKSISAKMVINRDFNFWEYHKKELSKVGIDIQKGKIITHIALGVLDKILNPKKTIENIFINKYYKIHPP